VAVGNEAVVLCAIEVSAAEILQRVAEQLLASDDV